MTPPDASSSRAAGGQRDGVAELVRRHVVEQDPVGAGVERLGDLVQRVALDLDGKTGRPRARDRLGDRAGDAQVVVLDQDAVVEAEAMVRAAAAADGVLLELAQARRRLAGVEDRRAGAVDRVDVAAGERGDAAEAAEQVEREPLAREHRARRALETRGDRPRLDAVAVGGERLEGVGAQLLEDGRGDVEAADHAGLLEQDRASQTCALVDHGVRGRVARADVLGEPAAHVEVEVSSIAPAPRARRAGPDHGVRGEALVLEGEVGAEVAAAALLTGERALRDQARQRVRAAASRRSRPAASRRSPASRHISARNSGSTRRSRPCRPL